jgi:cytochrome P450
LTDSTAKEPVILDDGYLRDRETLLGRLRSEDPVCQAVTPDGLRVWLVTGYEEARTALADASLSKDSHRAAPLHERRQEEEGTHRIVFHQALTSHMLNMDPPDHTRLRKLVTKAFTLRRIEQLRPRVTELVSELLDGLSGRDSAELLEDYAFPLSIAVSGELFGIPENERDHFRTLSNGIAFASGPEQVATASFEIAEYLTELVALKRKDPADDLVTALVQARDEDDRLDEDELVAMTFLILTAGYETSGHLIGNGILTLLRNPTQLATLRADPTLLPGAVEEILRYEGPTATTTLRFTTAPVRLGEVTIPAGEFVLVHLGAANHDENRYPEPGQVDIQRDTKGHLAFGHGIHYCLGAPLGRLEGRTAIGGLVERFPDLALAADPKALRWRANLLFHGLEALPVRLR